MKKRPVICVMLVVPAEGRCCLRCGLAFDEHFSTSPLEGANPGQDEEDVSVCIECLNVTFIHRGTRALRQPTPLEEEALRQHPELGPQLQAAFAAIRMARAVKKQSN